ncbi:MAG: PE domain-containing protein [Mycobacterium sp.]|nr:PE domain-containing protein [Mycobacterium sp.]
MILNVNEATVSASAAAEAGVAAELGTAGYTAAAALLGVMPMGADLDSVQFAAALNAAGAAYLGTAAEHAANRELFAAAQSLAAATYTASDIIAKTALAL